MHQAGHVLQNTDIHTAYRDILHLKYVSSKTKKTPLSYLFLDLICVVKIVQCEGPLLLRVISRLHVTLHALCSHANMLSE